MKKTALASSSAMFFILLGCGSAESQYKQSFQAFKIFSDMASLPDSVGLQQIILSSEKNSETFWSFSDWCVSKDSLKVEAQHTVELLLEYAETSDCDAAEEILFSLIDIDLGDSQIVDLTPLASLRNLQLLHLSDNQITDITPLSSLSNLQELILYNNRVEDISPLENLNSLITLSLGNNSISDITPLIGLSRLRLLSLKNNPVSNLAPLSNLSSLRVLDLGETQILDITFLGNINSLEFLVLEGNQIIDVEPLANLTNLRWLDLKGNQVADVGPLELSSKENLKRRNTGGFRFYRRDVAFYRSA